MGTRCVRLDARSGARLGSVKNPIHGFSTAISNSNTMWKIYVASILNTPY